MLFQLRQRLEITYLRLTTQTGFWMNFFLRLKHWQLFFITWGIPIVIDIVAFSDPMLMFTLFPIMMISFMFGLLGWIWSISSILHKKLPPGVNLNLTSFKIIFAIPVVYMMLLIAGLQISSFQGKNGAGQSIGLTIWPLIVVLHLVSMVCIFLTLRFAAKTMKSVELARLAKFADYAGEFFLIWFSIIGIWILQPRLNRLAAENEQVPH